MRNRREIRLLLLAVLFAAVSFMASLCVVWADSPEFDDYSDLSGKRVSMLTGAPFEDLVRSKVPDVGEFSYYNSMPDMILALKNDKTDIDRYCLHNDVPPRTRYRIRLAFEELAQQILKDVLKQTALLFTIEYSQKDEKTEITAVYGGGRFDPADSDNSLSYNLLRGSVEELSYQYDQQAEKPNIVRIIIRE